MSQKNAWVLAVVAGAVLARGVAEPQEPAGPAAAPQGILVLYSGQVIEGRIERLGDIYQVSQPDEQLRIRASEVQFACRDLEEGYQRKLAAIAPQDISAHLELAQWCQRHGLLGRAAAELSAARAIDPNHPMLPLLQRRLKMAVETAAEPPPPARPVVLGPSNEQLDRMVRGMPPGSVEAFVQSTQPILMNHCMTSGCHSGSTEHRLQWIRAPLGETPNRRITQRNLYAALQWIDWDNPGDSPLLKAPRGPHGNVPTAIFTDRQLGQFQRLSEWVYWVAQKPLPDETAAPVAGIAAAAVRFGFDQPAAPRKLPANPDNARPISGDRPNFPGTVRSTVGENGTVPFGGGISEIRPPNPVRPASATMPVGEPALPNAAAARPVKPPKAAPPPRPADGQPQTLQVHGLTDPYDPAVINRQVFPPDAQAAPPTVPTPAARAMQKP
jgi:hypothetical protein